MEKQIFVFAGASSICYSDSIVKNNVISNNISPLSTNPTKWSNALKKFFGNSRQIVWVFDHFLGLALKRFEERFNGTEYKRNLQNWNSEH